MVPSTSRHGSGQPHYAASKGTTSFKSMGTNSSPVGKQNIKTSSMAHFREELQSSGISKSASRLIVCARTSGTRSNYNTAWEKFSSWCDQQEIDQFHCSINYVLNFLAHLFDTKKEYRTINNYRSAISAVHEPIDDLPVGQHPRVKALLKGISKERPPLLKYSSVWDVGQVLQYMKSTMPNNNELTPKDLTQKLVSLMGLTALSRGSELHALSIRGICSANNSYEIFPSGNLKHSKQGKANQPILFHGFPKDISLCPVLCIDAYLNITKPWREKLASDQKDLFWLSLLHHTNQYVVQ